GLREPHAARPPPHPARLPPSRTCGTRAARHPAGAPLARRRRGMTGEPTPFAGRMVDGRHRLPVRVYYEDTDFSGIVYHANYLKFCERGRSDMLRLIGIAHRELDRSGLAFAVRRMTCEFLRPARIDDLLEVVTEPIEIGGARLELAQSVERADQCLFTAGVTLALIDASGRPRRLPEALAVSLGGLIR